MRPIARLAVALAVAVLGWCRARGDRLRGPRAGGGTAGGDGWSVSLTASASEVFDGESVTFTATTNADVGPTPWFITIEDLSLPGSVEECGSGTTCSVTWTFDSPTTVVFQALVGDLPEPASLPGFILASSQTVSAQWQRRIICEVC